MYDDVFFRPKLLHEMEPPNRVGEGVTQEEEGYTHHLDTLGAAEAFNHSGDILKIFNTMELLLLYFKQAC